MIARLGTSRHATALETVSVLVPEEAVPAYEAALLEACGTVGIFREEDEGPWLIEGVKARGDGEDQLATALFLAAAATGVTAVLGRHDTPADGWLARVATSFPEQLVGRRFAIRGTHLATQRTPGRVVLHLDAGIAFGSGEHGSTRGCLRAFERIAYRRPRRILDLGTGSGVLAMAASALLHQRVLGTDIEPWSVRTAGENAKLNRLGRRTRFVLADGWIAPVVRAGGPYDLVFANILARPLCRMARSLAANLAPGGTAILAGLLDEQRAQVVSAHRRSGLRLAFTLHEGRWATLVLRKPA